MNSSMGAEITSRDVSTMAMVREPGPEIAGHSIETARKRRFVHDREASKAACPAENRSAPVIRFGEPARSPAETLADLAAEAWRPILAFLRMIGRCARRVEHAARARRDRARLHAMPDHLLKDLGIPRCAIPSVAVSRETALAEKFRLPMK